MALSRARVQLGALALVGALLSLYLGLYQLGVIGTVWDPFFGGNSSHAVLRSSVSRALPVPDALLGAANYAVELALDLVGRADRARTHPWIVLLFALPVVAGALTGGVLVAAQALVLGRFCSLCLVSAGLSLAIAVVARPEITEAWSWRRERATA
jgi:uncharacterized membrane protein